MKRSTGLSTEKWSVPLCRPRAHRRPRIAGISWYAIYGYPMELSDLIDFVGESLFAEACACAWATGAGTGRRHYVFPERWGEEVQGVPHKLADRLWDAPDESDRERVETLLALYRCMPQYAHLLYAKHHFGAWDQSIRQLFWLEYRRLLDDPDDRLADPVGYSLWCDFFEDDETVDEAWAATGGSGLLNDRGLERVLEVSGPVPYPSKAKLYSRLIPDLRWHTAIFRSLLLSVHDAFGQLDIDAAKAVFRELRLPEQVEGRAALEKKLGLLS